LVLIELLKDKLKDLKDLNGYIKVLERTRAQYFWNKEIRQEADKVLADWYVKREELKESLNVGQGKANRTNIRKLGAGFTFAEIYPTDAHGFKGNR